MKNFRHPRWLMLLLALGLVGMLGACGQKGDLYLPDKPQQTHPESAP